MFSFVMMQFRSGRLGIREKRLMLSFVMILLCVGLRCFFGQFTFEPPHPSPGKQNIGLGKGSLKAKVVKEQGLKPYAFCSSVELAVAWAGAMGPITVSQILKVTLVSLCFTRFQVEA